jgi:hypothetical protein
VKDKIDKSQKEMLEKSRAEQEKLFSTMKTDIVTNLNGSIGKLEKELTQIKGQQGRLEGLNKTSESE